MKKESIHSYYWFGTCLRYLQDAKPGWRIHDTDQGDWFVLSNINRFFEYLDELGLRVTRRTSGKLKALKKELEGTDENAILTDDQATRLSDETEKIRNTLEAELRGLDAYVVSPKRLDVQRLTADVASLFAPNVFWILPDIARYDFTEAGRCVAFEVPTAAAFHLLRGTESVLRTFYCALVKQKRASLMWGPMVADLRKRRKARIYEVLINHLDNIRLSFRNPTQHPEKIYDIHEVQDLFSLCVDAVNRMAEGIR